ncbi:Beta-1,4-galactosyltransferase 1 [Liparis tanakae]|uniref:Beta-1,4-galactosyltransferase 1 n=1 Tax=Liparis tanakae TaxID=230148 RepID=A0A4Z2IV53_9TELE|nr:Beta-1,4-galactosyltransferase 1 [Liparis tanakae]
MAADHTVRFSLLHRTCKLVVLLCLLHISVTVFFYVCSLDIRFSFVQNQQSKNESSAQGNPDRNKDFTSGTEPKVVEVKKELVTQEEPRRPPQELEECPETSPLLVGPLRVEFTSPVDLDEVKRQNPALQPGGRYRPGDCVARAKVAVIIPFRRREEHLKFWLFYLHPILQRQQLDYGVYVINQDGEQVFNRAKLLNVGYLEALKDAAYDCFVFSDVDLIPMDDRNTYRCFSQPRHLSVSMDKFGFR